jgi:ribonuclease G
MPYAGSMGISRKIEDKKERSRLKSILRELTLPAGMGVIIRTAGEGKKARYFIATSIFLPETLGSDHRTAWMPPANHACLYVEPDIVGRTIRDFLTEEVDRVMVDKKEDYDRVMEEVMKISPVQNQKFKSSGKTSQSLNASTSKDRSSKPTCAAFPSPSGGEIVIEETEALISIDVNTGAHKNKSKGRQKFHPAGQP